MFSSALHEICKLWEVHSSSWIVALRRDVVADLWKPATSGILMKLQPESTHSPFRSIHLVKCKQFVDLIAKIREIRRNNLNKKPFRNAPGGGTALDDWCEFYWNVLYFSLENDEWMMTGIRLFRAALMSWHFADLQQEKPANRCGSFLFHLTRVFFKLICIINFFELFYLNKLVKFTKWPPFGRE